MSNQANESGRLGKAQLSILIARSACNRTFEPEVKPLDRLSSFGRCFAVLCPPIARFVFNFRSSIHCDSALLIKQAANIELDVERDASVWRINRKRRLRFVVRIRCRVDRLEHCDCA
jgi:hypothetical protein